MPTDKEDTHELLTGFVLSVWVPKDTNIDDRAEMLHRLDLSDAVEVALLRSQNTIRKVARGNLGETVYVRINTVSRHGG